MTFETASSYLGELASGLQVTLLLTAASFVVGASLGLILALARSSQTGLLRVPATVYINVFLSTPVLVQLFWIYYVLPQQAGILLTDIQVLILALGLNSAAAIAEVYRAGLIGVDPGQTDAARVLGLSSVQTLRRVVLPQAIRIVLPPLASATISLLKDSSLATFIGANDLLNSARTVAIHTFRPLEVFTIVAILYFLLTYPISLFSTFLERRFSVSRA